MKPLFGNIVTLCKHLGVDRQVIAILEKRGLPPVDPAIGMYYFPAVQQWLDTWYGVGSANAPCIDGHENGWAAKKPKKIRDVV